MSKDWWQSWAGGGPLLQGSCFITAVIVIAAIVIVTKIVTLTMSQNKYNYNLYTTYIILCIILVSYCCDFHAWVSRYMWCYGGVLSPGKKCFFASFSTHAEPLMLI